MRIQIVSEIRDVGYPTNHKRYSHCHKVANKIEKERIGKIFVQRHKKGTLLGSHTRNGTILISEIVPTNKRKNITIHENAEHRCMDKGKAKKK